jgi:hypothetical protein
MGKDACQNIKRPDKQSEYQKKIAKHFDEKGYVIRVFSHGLILGYFVILFKASSLFSAFGYFIPSFYLVVLRFRVRKYVFDESSFKACDCVIGPFSFEESYCRNKICHLKRRDYLSPC